jgi:hypothetical protein
MVARGPGRPTKYVTSDGKRVPGVTTVTGRFKDGSALIRWAFNCGRDGIDIDKARDDAGDVGHFAHALIEAAIHGEVYPTSDTLTDEQCAAAGKALDAFLAWRDMNRVEILVTELPLVSDRFRFGGTLDALGTVDGELSLLDWKTGNRIYPEFIAQVAAYRQLWEEHNPDQPIKSLHLLRVGKEHGDFHHHSWPLPVLDLGWEAFALMRSLYDLDKQLVKAVG